MSARVPVRLALHFGEQLPEETAAVVAAVDEYLGVLVDALQIPVDPDIELVAGRPQDAPADRLRFAVRGVVASVPQLGADDPPTVEAAVQAASLTLLDGRDRLITAEVADTLWREWSAGSDAPPRGHRAVLRSAVRCGLRLDRLQAAVADLDDPQAPGAAATALERALEDRGGPEVRIALGPALYGRCHEPESGEALPLLDEDQNLPDMLMMMSDGLFYMLGLIFDVVTVADESLGEREYSVSWYDLPGPALATMAPDEIMVNVEHTQLSLVGIEGRAAVNPGNGAAGALVEREQRDLCHQFGYTTWGPFGYIVLCASVLTRRAAAAFVDARFTRLWLSRLGEAFPTLVQAAEARFDRDRITRVLRYLAEEEISVRDARGILEGMLAVQGVCTVDQGSYIVFDAPADRRCLVPPGKTLESLDAGDYAEMVRNALRSYVSHKHSQSAGSMVAFLLDPALEAELQGADEVGPERRRAIADAVHQEVDNMYRLWNNLPVILTTVSARKPMRRLIEAEFPELAVVSYQELVPDLNIQPVARITVE